MFAAIVFIPQGLGASRVTGMVALGLNPRVVTLSDLLGVVAARHI